MQSVHMLFDRISIVSNDVTRRFIKRRFLCRILKPRNKDLVRVFSDLGLVEQLGSGVERIVKVYGREVK